MLRRTLLILEKPNVEIFKVSESYVQNCVVRGREVNQLTHAAEAMGIPILLTVQQRLGKTFLEVDDLAAGRSEGLIPGWEEYWNSQRGRIGAVTSIAILLFPPRKAAPLREYVGYKHHSSVVQGNESDYLFCSSSIVNL